MEYLRQIYSTQKSKMEQDAINNSENGVEARFICNKIVKTYFRILNKKDYSLTVNRLNRLVLLVEIAYMQENKGKHLIKDGFYVSKNGLISKTAIFKYCYLLKDREELQTFFTTKEKDYQLKAESLVNKEFNRYIDKLVYKVINATRYISNISLKKMFNNDEIQMLRREFEEYENQPIPEDVFSSLIKDFNFEGLEKFNSKQRIALGISNGIDSKNN